MTSKIQHSTFNIQNHKAFTLIELVIVIVILGVIGSMGADFISKAFMGFADTEARMEIYEEGKLALLRMEREIRNAVPNAVNLASATDLQIGAIDEQAMQCATAPCTFFQYSDNNPAGKTFISDLSLALAGGAISIYNRNWSDFATAGSQRLYNITGTAGPRKMNLHKAVIAASPAGRYYAVDKAIRYYLDGNVLKRAETTVSEGSSVSFAAATGYPLAKNISSLIFGYQAGTLTRNGLVTVSFTMQNPRGTESVDFYKEISIANAP